MRYSTAKYTVCRLVRASFSPEMLQAGAVMGLMELSYWFFFFKYLKKTHETNKQQQQQQQANNDKKAVKYKKEKNRSLSVI